MSADTAAKRRSAMLLTMPFRGVPYPQGSNDAGQRAAGLFLYALASTIASTAGPPQYIVGVPDSGLIYIAGVPDADDDYIVGS